MLVAAMRTLLGALQSREGSEFPLVEQQCSLRRQAPSVGTNSEQGSAACEAGAPCRNEWGALQLCEGRHA